MFGVILATGLDGAIGYKSEFPWSPVVLREDLKRFYSLTRHNIVIYGRFTYQSILNMRGNLSIGGVALPNRYNIVVSRTMEQSTHRDMVVVRSFQQALDEASRYRTALAIQRFVVSVEVQKVDDLPKTFVIGGKDLFEKAIRHPDCHELYITDVHETFPHADVRLCSFVTTTTPKTNSSSRSRPTPLQPVYDDVFPFPENFVQKIETTKDDDDQQKGLIYCSSDTRNPDNGYCLSFRHLIKLQPNRSSNDQSRS